MHTYLLDTFGVNLIKKFPIAWRIRDANCICWHSTLLPCTSLYCCTSSSGGYTMLQIIKVDGLSFKLCYKKENTVAQDTSIQQVFIIKTVPYSTLPIKNSNFTILKEHSTAATLLYKKYTIQLHYTLSIHILNMYYTQLYLHYPLPLLSSNCSTVQYLQYLHFPRNFPITPLPSHDIMIYLHYLHNYTVLYLHNLATTLHNRYNTLTTTLDHTYTTLATRTLLNTIAPRIGGI